jgi:hypothetical protein
MAAPKPCSKVEVFRQGLITKNTFLDCQSPWKLEQAAIRERPKSDPTSSSAGTSSGMSENRGSSLSSDRNSTKEQCKEPAFSADAKPSEPGEGGRERRDGQAGVDDSALKGHTNFHRITRTMRRRIQRKNMRDRMTKGEVEELDDASGGLERSKDEHKDSTKLSL